MVISYQKDLILTLFDSWEVSFAPPTWFDAFENWGFVLERAFKLCLPSTQNETTYWVPSLKSSRMSPIGSLNVRNHVNWSRFLNVSHGHQCWISRLNNLLLFVVWKDLLPENLFVEQPLVGEIGCDDDGEEEEKGDDALPRLHDVLRGKTHINFTLSMLLLKLTKRWKCF